MWSIIRRGLLLDLYTMGLVLGLGIWGTGLGPDLGSVNGGGGVLFWSLYW